MVSMDVTAQTTLATKRLLVMSCLLKEDVCQKKLLGSERSIEEVTLSMHDVKTYQGHTERKGPLRRLLKQGMPEERALQGV